MLVLCVGMYRACSTWQYGVVGALLEKHRGGQRLGFVEGIRFAEKQFENPRTSEWAVLKAHDYHDHFGEILASGDALGFYSYRDLRDAVSSYIHKTGTDLPSLLDQGFIELCLNNDRIWRDQPGILVQNYHDLIADPARGVEQIARHLGICLEPGEAVQVAEGLSWEANRRKVEAMSARLRDQGHNLVAQDFTKFDPVSLFHWNHIRSTDPVTRPDGDDFRQRATVEQLCRPWLVANGFEAAIDPNPGRVPSLAPAIRTSFALGAVDIRLDRLFRGTKGTVYDFDAPHPQVGNASNFLYLRGWRGLNLATTSAGRPEVDFAANRSGDVVAHRLLGSPAEAPGVMTQLVEEYRLQPPDIMILNAATDAELVVGAIASTHWRPKVYVVDTAHLTPNVTPWGDRLARSGYRAVPGLIGPALYVREDLAGEIPSLARSLGRDDYYLTAYPELEIPPMEALSLPEVNPTPATTERGIGARLYRIGHHLWSRLRTDPATSDLPRANSPMARARINQASRRS